jgi:sortase A
MGDSFCIMKLINSLPKRIIALVLILVAFFVAINSQAIWQRLKPKPAMLSQPQVVREKSAPNHISIPALGIEAPIQYAEEANEEEFQRLLEDGVVHYPGTANPGQLGNAYIFGHSSDFLFSKGKYKTVFAPLVDVQNGTEIYITDQEGFLFTYIVTDHFVANKDDIHLLDQGENKKKLLTLQTSYPIGTALKRYIAVAELKE